MSVLFLDIESRSRGDLGVLGAVDYASDPSTEVISIQWAIDNNPVRFYSPLHPLPHERDAFVRDFATLDEDTVFVAHNAPFDWMVYHRKLPQLERATNTKLPEFKLDQVRCTQYACAYLNLPLSLNKASQELVGDTKEDSEVMLYFSKPDALGGFPDFMPHELAEFKRYAVKDTELLRRLSKALPPLKPNLWAELHTSMRMNIRGVKGDKRVYNEVMKTLPSYLQKVDDQLYTITDSIIKKSSESEVIKKWVNGLCKSYGKHYDTLGNKEIRAILAEEDENSLPPKVIALFQVLLRKADANKWSGFEKFISKKSTFTSCFKPRGTLAGRWASKRMQLQNLPAHGITNDEVEFEDIGEAVALHGVEQAASDLKITERDIYRFAVRPSLIARDNMSFVIRDYGQIEDRIACFINADRVGLEAYAKGVDPYVRFARETLFKKENISKRERSIAKQAKLSLNYGMGTKTFKKRCRLDGIIITTEDLGIPKEADPYAHVVEVYRKGFSELFEGDNIWKILDTLINDAVAYGQEGSYLNDRIWTRLTRQKGKVTHFRVFTDWGLELSFWHPRVGKDKEGNPQPQVMASGADKEGGATGFRLVDLYGGKLYNNLCQGTAHMVLASTLVRSDKLLSDHGWGYPLMTVHDEITWEIHDEYVEQANKVLESLMATQTAALSSIPFTSSGVVSKRFTK